MAEIEESCSPCCGYVSTGRDLLEHQAHEHATCTECGSEPRGADSVTHKSGCPRLRPGYVYSAAL